MPLLTPAARLRAAYYLLFTMVGVFHAEVLSRSQPWALVDPAMVILVWPVYGVHYLVLGDLLLRRRADSLVPLFLAGCLLGMYEFVITKVYWVPPWNPASGAEVGFAWFEVLWVGFAWHAFMSFLIPFVLMQRVFLPGSPDPRRSRQLRWVLVGAPAFAAAFGTAFGAPADELLKSIGVSLAMIAAASFVFSRKALAWGYARPEDLVLGRLGRRAAVAALVAVYVLYGLTLQTDAVPSGLALLAPVPLYAMLIAMLYPHLKRGGAGVGAAPRAVLKVAFEAPGGGPATPESAPLPATAGGGELQPPTPVAAPLPPPSPWAAARSFLTRYGAAFALAIVAAQLIAIVAAPVLYAMVFVMIFGGTLTAVLLLGWSARAGWRVWRAQRGGDRAVSSPG